MPDTPMQLGLVIATGLAAGHVFVGTILLLVNGRRVRFLPALDSSKGIHKGGPKPSSFALAECLNVTIKVALCV